VKSDRSAEVLNHFGLVEGALCKTLSRRATFSSFSKLYIILTLVFAGQKIFLVVIFYAPRSPRTIEPPIFPHLVTPLPAGAGC